VDPGGRGAILSGRDLPEENKHGTPPLDAVSDPPMYCCRCGRVARRSVLNDDLNKPATCNAYRIILIFRRVQVETIGKHSLEVAPTILAIFSAGPEFLLSPFNLFRLLELRFYGSLNTKWIISETLPKPFSWLVWKTKHNTTKAHIHQSNEMYYNIK